MRVLITGHLGFIGAVMVPLVQKAGHEVTGLDIGLYDGCDFGPAPAPIREIRADLRDVDGSLLKGFDAVAVRSKPDASGKYEVSHSAAVAVVDPQGRLAAKINPPFDPAPTAEFLADLFRRHENPTAKR